MKRSTHIVIFRIIGIVFSLCILTQNQILAEDWYDYYQQSKQAAQKKEWETAITLLKKAIAEEPEPARHKQYGLQGFTYYPYMELGMAYLAIGDMEAAHQNCTLAEQKGSAPEDVVKTCLSISSKYLQQVSASTPAPKTTQAMAAKTFPERPTIELMGIPPATTTLEAVVLQGAALDKDGVAMIKFYARNRGVTGITTLTTPKRPEEPFNITIPLDFGLTEITIEVTDTRDEKFERLIPIERLSPDQPKATPVPPTAVPVKPTVASVNPTATPVIPTPTPEIPTPTPIVPTATPSPLKLLLQEGDRYFEKRWFTTGGPDGRNAFGIYQEALQLDPTNAHAREQIYEIMRFYKSWGDNNVSQNPDKAQTYYERYVQIATYINAAFYDQLIAQEMETVQRVLDELAATPTPALSTPTPMPLIPTATPILPTPTPRPLMVPTATPIQSAPTPTQPMDAPKPEKPLDAPPTLRFLSEIPSETSQEILAIRGEARDAEGVVEIRVEVVNQGSSKGLLLEMDDESSRGPQPQIAFDKEVPLALGNNTILVLVRDTAGQEQQETFHVTRIAPTQALTTAPAGDVYAVIIGIGDYKDSRLNLHYTVNDAQGLYDLLIDPNYGGVSEDHIQLLLNENATDRQIKGAIGKWLGQQAGEEDTVIIYYSGHGAPEGNETYWVTYNADIDDLYTTALSNNDIADMLGRIQAKRVITFLDSCYSAATVHRQDRTRSAATEIPWEKFTGTGRVVISASDGKQESLELDEYQHGVFTYYLLEGLRGKADSNNDYVVDVDEIWDYVKYQVTDTARRAGNTQTPVFQGAITAGIPLTINQAGMTQKQHITQLKLLFEQGNLSPEHFACAYQMLSNHETNPYLEGLLSGKLSPEIFKTFFTCP